MKLLIEVEKDYYEMIKYNVEHGQEYKPFEIIANGIPYEERPQGEWIMDNEHTKNSLLWYKCNLCGVYHSPTNFCPHCGADMRSESEAENE